MKRRKERPKDPQFDRLVEDIVKIIKSADREIEKIRKNFPDIPNPLEPTKRRKSKRS